MNPARGKERLLFMKRSDFYFDLPEELIAQTPLQKRDSSRMLLLDKETGAIDHCFVLDQTGNTEIKVFDCIMEEYTVKLTDHYPLLIDVRL